MLQHFVAPALDQPLAVEDCIERVPRYATIKGMFLTNLMEIWQGAAKPLLQPPTRYVALRDYPLVDQVRLIPQIAAELYPAVPLRQAILQLGRFVCPTFAKSLAGKALLSAVGSDVSKLVHAGSIAYSISSNVGRTEVVELGPRSARISMRDMFSYVDCYQVGILEGAWMMLGHRPTIRVQLQSSLSAEMQVSW